MLVLSGFKTPVQESHPWNVKKKWDWKNTKGLKITKIDNTSAFGHKYPLSYILGLYHMPIFGGLTTYVVIEAMGFNKYWHIGWNDSIQLHRIKENRVKLLISDVGYIVHGVGDNGKILKLKIVGYGKLGDGKYNNMRLF